MQLQGKDLDQSCRQAFVPVCSQRFGNKATVTDTPLLFHYTYVVGRVSRLDPTERHPCLGDFYWLLCSRLTSDLFLILIFVSPLGFPIQVSKYLQLVLLKWTL